MYQSNLYPRPTDITFFVCVDMLQNKNLNKEDQLIYCCIYMSF